MIDKIKEPLTPSQQMSLSELLNAEIKVVDCWHEKVSARVGTSMLVRYRPTVITMCICGKEYWGGDFESHTEYYNSNLFTSASFLTVFRAVKDRDWFDEWLYTHSRDALGEDISFKSIAIVHIASPHFQLGVLRELNPEGFERVMKEEEKGGKG